LSYRGTRSLPQVEMTVGLFGTAALFTIHYSLFTIHYSLAFKAHDPDPFHDDEFPARRQLVG